MKKVFYIFRRLALLLFAALWFQMITHIDICHSDDKCCQSESHTSNCSCLCHTACINQAEPCLPVEHCEPVRIPSVRQSVRALLLPDDIFRPPLTANK